MSILQGLILLAAVFFGASFLVCMVMFAVSSRLERTEDPARIPQQRDGSHDGSHDALGLEGWEREAEVRYLKQKLGAPVSPGRS